jgi:hypothetical protein
MKGLFRGDPFPQDLGAFLDRAGRVLRDLGLPRLHMALAAIARREEEWRDGRPREDDLTLVLLRRDT